VNFFAARKGFPPTGYFSLQLLEIDELMPALFRRIKWKLMASTSARPREVRYSFLHYFGAISIMKGDWMVFERY
jgi:hypothetical protein